MAAPDRRIERTLCQIAGIPVLKLSLPDQLRTQRDISIVALRNPIQAQTVADVLIEEARKRFPGTEATDRVKICPKSSNMPCLSDPSTYRECIIAQVASRIYMDSPEPSKPPTQPSNCEIDMIGL